MFDDFFLKIYLNTFAFYFIFVICEKLQKKDFLKRKKLIKKEKKKKKETKERREGVVFCFFVFLSENKNQNTTGKIFYSERNKTAKNPRIS
jgi:hypothetical protein